SASLPKPRRPNARAGGDVSSAGRERSETLEQIVRAGDVEGARLLNVELLDDAVVDQHRETLAAMAHSELGEIGVEAERLDEIAAAVGEHRHFPLRPRALRPGLEDERVVDRGAGDLVDALGLELV